MIILNWNNIKITIILNKIGTPLYCSNSTFLCQNGGTCVNQTNVNASAFFGFTCQCPAGYSGELCETSKHIISKQL